MQKNNFSMRLKTLLKQKQLTLAEVAKAINMSAPSVHRWTRGGEIEYENLRALAGEWLCCR
jgi:transcriptional regulator with XRE-family HTH domain